METATTTTAPKTIKTVATQKPAAKPAKKSNNPYREGGLRFAIFALGAKGYKTRAELAAKLAKTERTSAEKVGFQIAVVASATHPGNEKRSKEIEKGDKKFLVAC